MSNPYTVHIWLAQLTCIRLSSPAGNRLSSVPILSKTGTHCKNRLLPRTGTISIRSFRRTVSFSLSKGRRPRQNRVMAKNFLLRVSSLFRSFPTQCPTYRSQLLRRGVITTAVGLAALYLLPTWPETTKIFTDEERRIAIARVRNESTDGQDESQSQSFWVSFKKAFTVHSSLCIIGYSCINVSVAGLSTFMPTVVRTLGRFGTIEIQLRTVPPFAVSAVWSVLISYLSWKTQKRGMWIMISIPMGILVRTTLHCSLYQGGYDCSLTSYFPRDMSSSSHQ